MMSAHVEEKSASFQSGPPVELFRGRYRTSVGRYYDITPDGRNFLMIENAVAPGEDNAHVVLIQNLDEELKRRFARE
jgi:hypothetical protein